MGASYALSPATTPLCQLVNCMTLSERLDCVVANSHLDIGLACRLVVNCHKHSCRTSKNPLLGKSPVAPAVCTTTEDRFPLPSLPVNTGANPHHGADPGANLDNPTNITIANNMPNFLSGQPRRRHTSEALPLCLSATTPSAICKGLGEMQIKVCGPQ